jgi:hypothetical protein
MASPRPSTKKVTHPCIAIQDSKQLAPKTVIVTGCGRGGTSAIAGAIHALGITMVDDAETSINFEDSEFTAAGTDLKLKDQSASPYIQTCQQIRSIINIRNQINQSWGWKDPYAHHYLRGIIDICRNPLLIYVVRNPFDIANSMIKAARCSGETLTIENAFGHSLQTLQWIWESAQHCGVPTLFVSFEQALFNKVQLITDLCTFLELNPDQESLNKALRFITPDGGYRTLNNF